MNTYIIYDESGDIYLTQTGGTAPQGNLQLLTTQIPDGKMIKGVDISVTPNAPIFEDIPETDAQKIAVLQSENADINYALMMNGLL